MPPLLSPNVIARLLTIPTLLMLLQPGVPLELPLGLTTVLTANPILLVAIGLLLRYPVLLVTRNAQAPALLLKL